MTNANKNNHYYGVIYDVGHIDGIIYGIIEISDGFKYDTEDRIWVCKKINSDEVYHCGAILTVNNNEIVELEKPSNEADGVLVDFDKLPKEMRNLYKKAE